MTGTGASASIRDSSACPSLGGLIPGSIQPSAARDDKEIDMDIKGLNESARKVHGADISIQVARAVGWGNDDTFILVYGRRHALAAADLARAALRNGSKPVLAQETARGFMGGPDRQYSTVQFT